ncbi:hypothetical protein ACS0TY_014753 [Phlomoides rotata]
MKIPTGEESEDGDGGTNCSGGDGKSRKKASRGLCLRRWCLPQGFSEAMVMASRFLSLFRSSLKFPQFFF